MDAVQLSGLGAGTHPPGGKAEPEKNLDKSFVTGVPFTQVTPISCMLWTPSAQAIAAFHGEPESRAYPPRGICPSSLIPARFAPEPFMAALRMVLEVEVQAGNQTASQFAQPGL